MSNFKLIKTATALALGASLVTSAIVPAEASAASKYKVSKGKLVVAKTGKVATGYVTYNKTVYYKGVKLTGLKSKVYYKAGKKATGTYKGAYYVKGAKKATTGTYNKAYYVKGKKVVSTGTYNKAYYVAGKKVVSTGTYNKAYYVAGKKVVSTGTYKGSYYVAGKKVVTDGLYKEELYTEGALNKGYKLYDAKLYKDAVLNKGLVSFEEKFYFDADLANGTYEYEGKEEAFEKGLKVGAKVSSVEAVNAKTVVVKFNKSVDKTAAELATNYTLNNTDLAAVTATVVLSTDAKTATITLNTALTNNSDNVLTVKAIKTAADATVNTELYTQAFKFADAEKPSFVNLTNTVPGTVTANFSELLDATTIVPANVIVTKADGTAVTVVTTGATTGQLTLAPSTTGNGFTLTGLEDKVVYNVTVVGLKDLVGHLTNPNIVKFTATSTAVADTVAPKVTDVKAKGLDTVVVSVDEALANLTPAGLATYVTLAGTGLTLDTAVAQVYDKDAGTVTVKLASTLPTEGEVKTITVSGFKDASNNLGVNFVKNVGFTNISNITKSELVTVNTATPGVTQEAIKVTFDNDITLGTATAVNATLLTKDNLEKTVTIPAAAFSQGTVADKETNVLYINLSTLASTLEAGTLSFTVSKTAHVVTLSKDANVSVAYTTLSADKSAPELNLSVGTNGITVADNKVTVKYTQEMGQSALDLTNYTVDGKNVFEKAVFKGDKLTVELTVKADAIELPATYDVVIAKAVTNAKGISLAKDYVTTEAFVSTVQPTVASAKLANGVITVTFDKAVTTTLNTFDLYIGGVKVASTTPAVTSATTATITPTTALTAADLTKAITIQLATGAEVKDTNNNVLKAFSSVTVAQ